MNSLADFNALAELLDQKPKESDPFSGKESRVGQDPVNPTGSGPTPASVAVDPPKPSEEEEADKEDDGDIWDEDEVPNEYTEVDDGRTQPEYEILYKQSIGSSDTYLGMDFDKDPSSMSCEALLVRIFLPSTKFADVTLDVTATTLKVRTDKYKLILALPREVKDKDGSAKFDADKGKLEVTLPVLHTMETKVMG
eukprot:TRINITY_DN869_c0_g1_i1.p1 TRINITY_DN869_c0_g1~~TRINITY_DN869_c0_g1_i1.p1  ORF type:complete len:195 (+),score=32.92 TRINITY_DN869_c0_g1_i1:325-909(+)